MCHTAIILDPEDFVRLLQVLLHIRALETEEILDPFHLLRHRKSLLRRSRGSGYEQSKQRIGGSHAKGRNYPKV